jgi:hypothetical protein
MCAWPFTPKISPMAHLRVAPRRPTPNPTTSWDSHQVTRPAATPRGLPPSLRFRPPCAPAAARRGLDTRSLALAARPTEKLNHHGAATRRLPEPPRPPSVAAVFNPCTPAAPRGRGLDTRSLALAARPPESSSTTKPPPGRCPYPRRPPSVAALSTPDRRSPRSGLETRCGARCSTTGEAHTPPKSPRPVARPPRPPSVAALSTPDDPQPRGVVSTPARWRSLLDHRRAPREAHPRRPTRRLLRRCAFNPAHRSARRGLDTRSLALAARPPGKRRAPP